MNTTEKNKIIAEFMGVTSYLKGSDTMYIFADNNHRSKSDLNYHNSWDWIMPVIAKIEKIEGIYDIEEFLLIRDELATARIRTVYGAVVRCIEYINNRNQIKSFKLEREGVILSTDNEGNEQIQRIDDAEQWMEDNDLDYIKQLESDEEAVKVVQELVIDNVIEIISQNLQEGDKSLLYELLKGRGLVPVTKLTEQELINEAKALYIL